MQLQKKFFDNIKILLPPNRSLVTEVSEILHCSEDSAYRRIRGDTQLGLEEIQLLAKNFSISLDELFEAESGGILFKYNSVQNKSLDMEKFFDGVAGMLEQLALAKDKKIIHATMDIPFYHLFQFPELALFKLYFWRKSLWDDKAFHEVDFSINYMKKIGSEYLENQSKRIFKNYLLIPSMEIWSDETIHSTLKQIEFYLHSGYFSQKEDCRIICECLCAQLDHVKSQAEEGFKYQYGLKPVGQKGNFQVYLNEVLFLDNIIYTENNGLKTIYLLHESMNILASQNLQFCEETYTWLCNQLKRANLISETSEKIRNNFFYSQIKKVENLMATI